ncbi:MAG: hypothetical protein AAF798_20950 [Bacteroidota bacterium]
MKTNYLLLIFVLNVLYSVTLSGQYTFEVGGQYTISSERLHSDKSSDLFEQGIFHSFGASAKLLHRSGWFFKGELNYQNGGTKLRFPETTTDMPEGTDEFSEASWRYSAVGLLFNTGYYLLNKEKIKIGPALGINTHLVTHQEQEVAGQAFSDGSIYEGVLFFFHTSLDIRISLSEKLNLTIAPFWQTQLNSNAQEWKQRAFGGALGVSYLLN